MNECMNDWMDAWLNEWRNEWMNECMNEWMNEWMNELINEWINDWMNEWMNIRTNWHQTLIHYIWKNVTARLTQRKGGGGVSPWGVFDPPPPSGGAGRVWIRVPNRQFLNSRHPAASHRPRFFKVSFASPLPKWPQKRIQNFTVFLIDF